MRNKRKVKVFFTIDPDLHTEDFRHHKKCRKHDFVDIK